jgi:hypothetical protein
MAIRAGRTGCSDGLRLDELLGGGKTAGIEEFGTVVHHDRAPSQAGGDLDHGNRIMTGAANEQAKRR